MKKSGKCLLTSCLLLLSSFKSHSQEITNFPNYSCDSTLDFKRVRSCDENCAQRGFKHLLRAPLQDPNNSRMELKHLYDLWKVWPKEAREEARQLDENQRVKKIYEYYGLLENNFDPKSKVPIGFTLVENKLSVNCLLCHAGKNKGEVIIGLNNNSLKFSNFMEDYSGLKYLLGKGKLTNKSKSKIISFGDSKGTTNAFHFSVILSMFRNKNIDQVKIPRFRGFARQVDLVAPPLWNTKFKSRLYSDSFTSHSPKSMMQFAMSDSNSGTFFRGLLPLFVEISQLIDSLEPPKPIGSNNLEAIKSGETVYNQNCASCHGFFGRNDLFPEKTTPIDVVKTDSLRLKKGVTSEFRKFYRDSWLGEGYEDQVIVNPTGFQAPPLISISRSPPYFKTGVIPNLRAVIVPKNRPKIWRSLKPFDSYDEVNVGLNYKTISAEEFDSLPKRERREFVDTRASGKSNKGHYFGENLTENDVDILIEFLKTR